MANQTIRTVSRIFQPALVGTAETKELLRVAAGERVLWVSVMPMIAAAAASNTTIEVGDGSDTDGFVAAIDTETMVAGTLIGGAGALLAASGGKLYTATDTVDAKYVVTTAGATNPKVVVTIAVVRDYPA
jgi:hypothetical protein